MIDFSTKHKLTSIYRYFLSVCIIEHLEVSCFNVVTRSIQFCLDLNNRCIVATRLRTTTFDEILSASHHVQIGKK